MLHLLKVKQDIYDNKIVKSSFLLILLAFVILSYSLLIYYFINAPLSGDDLSYFNHIKVSWSWIINERYLSWSSRVFLDPFIPFFTQHLVLLKILCIGLLLFSPFVLSQLVQRKNAIQLLLSFSVISLLPYYELKSAGFVSTIVNYYIPIILSLIVCTVVYSNNKLSPILFIPLLVISIIACNHEQSAVVILFFSLFNLIKNKLVNYKALGVFVVALASLVFIILAPGNSVRVVQETEHWMPEFVNFTVFDKLYIGLTSTFFTLCYHNNFPFVFLVVALVFSLASKIRWALLTLLFFTVCQEILRAVFKSSLVVENATWLNTYPSITLLFFAFYLIIILILLIKLNLSIRLKMSLLTLIALAFLLRILIGFSPTVFASSVRPSIIPQSLFIFCGAYILFFCKHNESKLPFLLLYFVIANFNKFILGYALLQ